MGSRKEVSTLYIALPSKERSFIKVRIVSYCPSFFFQDWSVDSGSHAHQECIYKKASTIPNLLPDQTEHLM